MENRCAHLHRGTRDAIRTDRLATGTHFPSQPLQTCRFSAMPCHVFKKTENKERDKERGRELLKVGKVKGGRERKGSSKYDASRTKAGE